MCGRPPDVFHSHAPQHQFGNDEIPEHILADLAGYLDLLPKDAQDHSRICGAAAYAHDEPRGRRQFTGLRKSPDRVREDIRDEYADTCHRQCYEAF